MAKKQDGVMPAARAVHAKSNSGLPKKPPQSSEQAAVDISNARLARMRNYRCDPDTADQQRMQAFKAKRA